MAKLKMLDTIFSKLNNLSKKNGQVIVTHDSKSLYFDLNGSRIEITDWIEINSEEERSAILSPLTNKYYYVKDSNKIWRYINSDWICLNEFPIYTEATTSKNGIMTSAMVSKLDGIADGANKTTVDSALSSTSTNPVQNKVINTALADKVDLSADGVSKAINQLSTGDSTPSDTDYYVSQYAGGETTTTTYHRRPMSALLAYIKSKLALVATSGSYNDLNNKPTIPTVGNGTITITQNGTSKGTFTTNQSGNTTIALADNNTTYSTGTTSTSGLTKLYTVTGTATDGTMTQNAIKSALDGKASSSHTHTNLDSIGSVGYYGSDSASTSGWYEVYSTTLAGYSDHVARLSIISGYSTIANGIINLHLRCDNSSTISVKRLSWENRQGFSVGDVIINTNGNTWTLYVKQSNSQYGRIKVRVLESMGTSTNWTMTLTSNTTKESSTPTATVTATDGGNVNYANSAGTATNATKVNNHTVNEDVPSGAKFTDTNTWRGIQDNLTSTSTTDSLSANQGKVLKGLIDGKTSNIGTITGIKMNGASKGTSGVVDLGTVLTGGKQTTTSMADGGSNVYTFSDDSTITVKNGGKGSNGTSAAWFTGTAVTGTSTSVTAFTVSGSKAGDMYLNTSTYNIYKASAANSWVYVCNIKGATGSPGTNGTTPTIKVAAGSNIGSVGTPSVTASTSGTTTTFTFNNLKGQSGSNGTRGSAINFGTAITGTSTTATVFSSSGLTSSLVNDMYLNTSTFNLYKCTTAGAASAAKWVYIGCIKGTNATTTNTATTSANGLMSSTDKAKIEKVVREVWNTTEPTGLSVNDHWMKEY